MKLTPIRLSFVTGRGSTDAGFFAPGSALRQQICATLHRLWLALIALPDRGQNASAADLPAEFFRFPPF
jgi:hypothetical protein